MKIAIAGFGVEGQSNYRYWSADPSNELIIVDEKEPDASILLPDAAVLSGEGVFERLDGFDMVIRTAGLSPYKIKTNGKVWSATNEFFARCRAPIIGVTGSKGKGTTASLIASILEKAGRKVWLVGNIGLPGLDVVAQIAPGDIVVYELSSFQLWDIERSPTVAVVLHIEQEHLDVHPSMEDYVSAKANITKYQSVDDILVFNAKNEYARHIAEKSNATKFGYQDESSAHVRQDHFFYGNKELCGMDALQLPGAHNLDNVCAAINSIWLFTQDASVIEAGLRAFKGLPHRLEKVATIDGVSYYDDSIATTPGSAIAALRAFEGHKILILGGSYKGSDFTGLAQEMLKNDVVALLIGDEAKVIAEAFQGAGFDHFEILHDVTMTQIVERARELARDGSTVLLSPSCASFGMFKNYQDRGDQFQTAVKSLTVS
ncbi:MAG: putative UDP-N-acetylmuramoylalanine--D-glutamate ligase [Candidatus Saccharibacteria bacterium]|nr:putative UDP-N-acetylmuramoylalanine--D-glutamate ligase [Candidatus Saccharibacteria bacterium]